MPSGIEILALMTQLNRVKIRFQKQRTHTPDIRLEPLNLPGIGDGDTETVRMIVMIVMERFMVRLKRSVVLVLC